jgi:hypothetical protein
MLSWRDVLDQETRREELERQAAQWRTANPRLPTPSPRRARLAAIAVRLGAWMERTGCRLQGQFADIEPTAILAAPAAETRVHGCS